MFSNNSPKNIPSVKKALYAFLLGLGTVGIVAITLTTIIGTRLFKGAEATSYGFISAPIIFTFILIFIQESKKLDSEGSIIRKVAKLFLNIVKQGAFGILILFEVIPLFVLSLENKTFYWNGMMPTELSILHMFISIIIVGQMYTYNRYIYKLLFPKMQGNETLQEMGKQQSLGMIGSFSLCIASIAWIWVYLKKFKTGDADIPVKDASEEI